MNKEKAGKWELAPIPLAGHDKIDEVVYWRRVGSPPAVAPTDIPLHPTCIIEYTGTPLSFHVLGRCRIRRDPHKNPIPQQGRCGPFIQFMPEVHSIL